MNSSHCNNPYNFEWEPLFWTIFLGDYTFTFHFEYILNVQKRKGKVKSPPTIKYITKIP